MFLLRITYRAGLHRRVTAFRHLETRRLFPADVVPVPCEMISRLLARMEALERTVHRSRSSTFTLRQTVSEVHTMQLALNDLQEWAELSGRTHYRPLGP